MLSQLLDQDPNSPTVTGTVTLLRQEMKNEFKLVRVEMKAMNHSIEMIAQYLNEGLMRMDRMDANIGKRFREQDARIGTLDSRLSALDTKIDKRFREQDAKIDQRFREQDAKFDELTKLVLEVLARSPAPLK